MTTFRLTRGNSFPLDGCLGYIMASSLRRWMTPARCINIKLHVGSLPSPFIAHIVVRTRRRCNFSLLSSLSTRSHPLTPHNGHNDCKNISLRHSNRVRKGTDRGGSLTMACAMCDMD